MSDYAELVRIFTSSDYKSRYARAKAGNSCICCGEQNLEFNFSYTKFEYSISALCENCQERFFYGSRNKSDSQRMAV